MISALSADPKILQELFDRLDIGCIIFEPRTEELPFKREDGSFMSLFEISDQIFCSTANRRLKEKLRLRDVHTFSLKDWIAQFPNAQDHLRICEKNGEVRFTIFQADLGERGAWIQGEYVIKYDIKGRFRCLIGVFKDVSSEKILRERVIHSQDKLEFAELILEISQKLARIGTWRFELKTKRLQWSDNLYKILDIPKSTSELYDAFIAQIHPEDVEGFLATFDQAVQTKSSYTVQYRCIKPNGQVVYCFGNGHPIFASNGEIEGYFGLSQDISELKVAQIKLENINKHLEAKVLERTKELEQSSRKMQLVLEQLQRQNEQLQQYTYIVSHNLRAPVANIHGLSELFDPQDTSSEENQQIIHNIARLSRQLDQIIIDLNEILSTEGKLELAFSEVNLTYEIQRVCEELSPQIKNSQAEIEMKVPNNLLIRAVKGYIFSIIHNLLENALKFKASDRNLKIEIGAQKNRAEYQIWLKDNGQGLDLKKHEKQLFKLHSRLHDTGTQGMGMGLFLVKSHIEQMGGSVEVESELNKGSCFTIRLPLID